MTNNIIITAGHAYVDIDVLASAHAYRELLRLEVLVAEVHLTGVWNATLIGGSISYQHRRGPSFL